MSRARNRALAALSLGLLASLPRAAEADDTHYFDYPLGGRAVGLGGAFGAIANDPSGIFYNPAGLVDASRGSVQISTNLYGLEVASNDEFVLESVAKQLVDLREVFTQLIIIPTSAGFLQHFGRRDAAGRAQHAYGAGLFVPQFRSFRLRTLTPGPEPGQQVLYRHDGQDRTLQPAVAYSMRVDDTWRFGVSAVMSYRTIADTEASTLVDRIGGTSFTGVETRLDAWIAWVSFRFGLQASLDERWHFGGTLTTPSISVANSASLDVLRMVSSPDEQLSELVLDQPQGLEASTLMPAQLRLSSAYVEPRRYTISADLTLHAPTRYDLLRQAGTRARVPDLTLITDIERELVVNLNLGFEYLVSKRFSVAVGSFTNFSSAPGIPGDPGDRVERAHLSNVDGFGGTLVAGLFSDHTLTRLGFTMTRGRGTDVIPRTEELLALGSGGTFRKVEASNLFVYFFASSTFRY